MDQVEVVQQAASAASAVLDKAEHLSSGVSLLFSAFVWGNIVPMLMFVGWVWGMWWMLAAAQRNDPTFKANDILRDEKHGKASNKQFIALGTWVLHSLLMVLAAINRATNIEQMIWFYGGLWSGAAVVLKFIDVWGGRPTQYVPPAPRPPPDPPAPPSVTTTTEVRPMITIDHLIGLLPSLLAAVGVYAAVRADLARLQARLDAQDRRLDGHRPRARRAAPVASTPSEVTCEAHPHRSRFPARGRRAGLSGGRHQGRARGRGGRRRVQPRRVDQAAVRGPPLPPADRREIRRDRPDLSYPKWTRVFYGTTQVEEHKRFNAAVALDPVAALQSTSFGLFQIMGFNHERCGFADAADMLRAFAKGEPEQLDGFVEFVRFSGLADELQQKRWADFARLYNGPGYAANRYDTKLAAAFARNGGN